MIVMLRWRKTPFTLAKLMSMTVYYAKDTPQVWLKEPFQSFKSNCIIF
jgi:hypothetical protein